MQKPPLGATTQQTRQRDPKMSAPRGTTKSDATVEVVKNADGKVIEEFQDKEFATPSEAAGNQGKTISE